MQSGSDSEAKEHQSESIGSKYTITDKPKENLIDQSKNIAANNKTYSKSCQ
jgi:hypothetical protein